MDLINLYNNNSKSIFFKKLQFEIIIIGILIFITIHNYITIKQMVILSFTVIILIGVLKIKDDKLKDQNTITMIKLQTIQKTINDYINEKIKKIDTTTKINNNVIKKMYKAGVLTHLYTDANLIHFIYSIIILNEYNKEEFYKFVKGVNGILKMKDEIEIYYKANGKFPININEMFETSLLLKTNTINNLHNFIYTIPKEDQMYKYLYNVIDRYTILIKRNIDKIYYYYQKNIKINGVNMSTKFINYNNTKEFYQKDNHYITPSKEQSKLLSFYI